MTASSPSSLPGGPPGRRPRSRDAFVSVALATALTACAASAQPGGSAPPPEVSSSAPFRGEEFSIGDQDAPVTVVEYLSVTCAHCAAFERDTWPRARRELVERGRVRFIIREMPTAPVALSAAGFLMARCRGEAFYWPTVERLLQDQAQFLAAKTADQAFRTEADIAGLSEADTRLCLSDPVSLDAINARRQTGLAEGVDSTPYFVVNGAPLRPGSRPGGELYEGGELSYGQLSAAVTAAEGTLKKAAPRP